MPKFNQRKNMNTKLIYCVRNDLKMGKGKIAAQVGHATIGIYQKNLKEKRDIMSKWLDEGQAKIVVKINSERDMNNLKYKAEQLGMCTHIVHDAGHTQVAEGSATVLVIGPDYDNRLKQITNHLKLL
jgi:PTH2 family peptidyl-tRNA hydrolase